MPKYKLMKVFDTFLNDNKMKEYKLCGFSSSGRARPSQGWGGGFESRNPLEKSLIYCSISEILIFDGVTKNMYYELFTNISPK